MFLYLKWLWISRALLFFCFLFLTLWLFLAAHSCHSCHFSFTRQRVWLWPRPVWVDTWPQRPSPLVPAQPRWVLLMSHVEILAWFTTHVCSAESLGALPKEAGGSCFDERPLTGIVFGPSSFTKQLDSAFQIFMLALDNGLWLAHPFERIYNRLIMSNKKKWIPFPRLSHGRKLFH